MTEHKENLSGDQLLNEAGVDIEGLAQVHRRPDVRLIVRNTSDKAIEAPNPGNHSDQLEHIPSGEAAMIMLKGDSLTEQKQNAANLAEHYGLKENGLTNEFMSDMKSGELTNHLSEFYGPAPLEGQANRLSSVEWVNSQSGQHEHIEPSLGEHCAFGARAPTQQTLVRVVAPADQPMAVAGTGTSSENLAAEGSQESQSIYLAIEPVRDPDNNWAPTGKFQTHPIHNDAADQFYQKEELVKVTTIELDQKGSVIDVSNANRSSETQNIEQANRLAQQSSMTQKAIYESENAHPEPSSGPSLG